MEIEGRREMAMRTWIPVVILFIGILSLMVAPARALDPVENLTVHGVAGNQTLFNATNFNWNPETGYYTRWWFNTSRDFFDVFGFFYGTYLPLGALISWGWLAFSLWGAIVTAYYIETQNATMPFVIGIFAGSVFSYMMGVDQIMLMVIAMVFLGGGVLAKVLLGRD